jgi:hypothetical protein
MSLYTFPNGDELHCQIAGLSSASGNWDDTRATGQFSSANVQVSTRIHIDLETSWIQDTFSHMTDGAQFGPLRFTHRSLNDSQVVNMKTLRLNQGHELQKQVTVPTVVKLMALSGAALLLGSCGLLANVGGGGPVVTGTVSAASGSAVPAASEYRMALVRYNIFGPGASELEAAEFLTPFVLSGGTGGFSGSLPASVDVGSGNTRAYYRVVVFDDLVDDNKYDRNASNGAGAKDRLLADSANGKAEGGNRYLIYASDNQDFVAGKPLSKGWNLVVDPNRDTNLVLNVGTADDTVTQAISGVNISY